MKTGVHFKRNVWSLRKHPHQYNAHYHLQRFSSNCQLTEIFHGELISKTDDATYYTCLYLFKYILSDFRSQLFFLMLILSLVKQYV